MMDPVEQAKVKDSLCLCHWDHQRRLNCRAEGRMLSRFCLVTHIAAMHLNAGIILVVTV